MVKSSTLKTKPSEGIFEGFIDFFVAVGEAFTAIDVKRRPAPLIGIVTVGAVCCIICYTYMKYRHNTRTPPNKIETTELEILTKSIDEEQISQ
jgi:hypothetical protein